MTKNNKQVQVLRFVFCCLIVLYHFTCRYSDIYSNSSFYAPVFKYNSLIGLFGFLVLSGFFAVNNNTQTGFKFLVRRVSSLYPPYLIAITLIFVIQLTGYLGEERSVSFVQYLLNIPFLNVLLRTGYVDGAHWYVFVSLMFFGWVFILRALKINNNTIFWYILSFCIIMFGIFVTVFDYQIVISIGNYFDYFVYFCLGIIINYTLNKKMDFKCIVCFYFSSIVYLCLTKSRIELTLLFFTCTIVVAALFERIKFLEYLHPFIYIGNYSYFIYLIHQNIGYILMNVFLKNSSLEPWLIIAITFVFVFAFGIAFGFIYKSLQKAVSHRLSLKRAQKTDNNF